MTSNDTTFGLELEFTGISRKKAAELIKTYLHSTYGITIRGLSSRIITDQQGREWKVENDPSIGASYDCQCELVHQSLQSKTFRP